MDLSIVIVSFNVRELLRTCLAAAIRSAAGLAAEIVVIDNASRDDSAAMVEAAFPGVTLIRNAENRGFAAACNQGLRVARGRHAVLLNPDAEPLGDALARMVRYLDGEPGVGIAGPQLLNADGTLQASGRAAPRLARLLGGALVPALAQSGPPPRDFAATASVDEVSGACMVVRLAVVAEVGELDEGFFHGYEDVDLCVRARKAGWRVSYFPAAQVRHHHGGSGGRYDAALRPKWERGQRHYVRKHHGVVAAALLGMVHGGKWIVRRALGRA